MDASPCTGSVNRQGCGRLTERRLIAENQCFQGTGGVSRENRAFGFRPGFLDTGTGSIYLSRFADGRLAPVHLLEGLPDQLALRRAGGGNLAIKDSVIAGFVYRGRFYTRDEAAKATIG